MEAYKQEYRKNFGKISTGLGLMGSDRANELVEKYDGDYVWLIIRIQSRVGDRVFLMSADDLVYK